MQQRAVRKLNEVLLVAMSTQNRPCSNVVSCPVHQRRTIRLAATYGFKVVSRKSLTAAIVAVVADAP